MILFSILIFTTNFLNVTILNLTYIFLEGSSQGKSVILFGLMGSILLLYPLFRQDGRIMQKVSAWNPSFRNDGRKYLKYTIILVFMTYLLGSLIEIIIRTKLGVSPFTTFVAMNPSPATTSITHSHVFKSVLGDLISLSGFQVPGNIHTGTSLIHYTSPLSFLVLISFPLTYLFGMISLNKRKDRYKVILAFAVTTSLIGMLDGGLFSTPALVGLSCLLGVYAIKEPFSPRDLLKPSVVIILIVILRLSIGIIGSNTDYHDATILDEKNPINLNGYNITKIEVQGNKTIIRISTENSDKTILSDLVNKSEGKADGIFLSWDIFTWVSSDTSVSEP
jgi:O-antigen ligase